MLFLLILNTHKFRLFSEFRFCPGQVTAVPAADSVLVEPSRGLWRHCRVPPAEGADQRRAGDTAGHAQGRCHLSVFQHPAGAESPGPEPEASLGPSRWVPRGFCRPVSVRLRLPARWFGRAGTSCSASCSAIVSSPPNY